MSGETQLVHYNQARQALELARTIDEVKDIRDKAEALRLYLKQVGESQESLNIWAEIKLRAERRVGELLGEMEKNKGAQGNPHGQGVPFHDESTQKLADLGINYSQSSRFQQIAAIPEDKFEQHIAETVASGEELTSAGMRRLAVELKRKQKQQEQRQQKINAMAETPSKVEGIIHGDFRLLWDALEDNSVDLFFTDPPYHAKQTELFGELARLAAAKLKPGNSARERKRIRAQGQIFR